MHDFELLILWLHLLDTRITGVPPHTQVEAHFLSLCSGNSLSQEHDLVCLLDLGTIASWMRGLRHGKEHTAPRLHGDNNNGCVMAGDKRVNTDTELGSLWAVVAADAAHAWQGHQFHRRDETITEHNRSGMGLGVLRKRGKSL